MNDLIRPAFYDAYHEIVPLERKHGALVKSDVVGPICESGDWLARQIVLPELHRGDLLAFSHAGAYAMSMASNYNTRPRAAEVMLRGGQWQVVRKREPLSDLWALEI